MADLPDYYELLDVAPTAAADEISAAYRSLARSAHPDAGGNAGLFRLIKEAHDTLMDPHRRLVYDRTIGIKDDLGGVTDPLALLTLGQEEAERGNSARARSAFQAVIASRSPEWLPLAWLGLGGVERDTGNRQAAQTAYQTAIETGDPAVVPLALVALGDLWHELGQHDDARLAYQRAIGTGNREMTPSALLSLGELEEALGNIDAARAAYQLTIHAGDDEFAEMAASALQDL